MIKDFYNKEKNRKKSNRLQDKIILSYKEIKVFLAS